MNDFHLLLVALTLRTGQCWILENQQHSEIINCLGGYKTGQAREMCFNESGIELDLEFYELPIKLFLSINPKILCKDKNSFIETLWCTKIDGTDCLSDEYRPYYTTNFHKIQDAVNFQCTHLDDLDYQCMRDITQNLSSTQWSYCTLDVLKRPLSLFKIRRPHDLCLVWALFSICYPKILSNCSCPELYEALLKNFFYPDICPPMEPVKPGSCYVPTTTTSSPTTTATTVSNAPVSDLCQASVVAAVLMLTTLAQIL